MGDDKPSNKQTIATVSALLLGIAGAAGWLKPPDNSATVKTYDATKGAIEALEDRLDDDFDQLDNRQREFELWVAKRLVEIDQDTLPENRRERVEPTPDDDRWQPPPRPPRPAPKPAAKLPQADEFLE